VVQSNILSETGRSAAIFDNYCREVGARLLRLAITGEAHYFEHKSGKVAGVKFFPSEIA
jgi:hypothetical protein